MAKINKISIIRFVVIIVLSGVLLTAGIVCAKPGGDVPALASRKKLSIEAGRSSQIKISGNNILEIKYSSSDKQIASVSKKGKITAKHTGVCKININVL